MRFLFLSNLYPPSDLGGLEQRCQEIAEDLKQRGHAVQVLTSGSPLATDSANGVTRSLHLQADMHYYRPADFFLKRPRWEKDNIRELRKLMDLFAPDAILVWGMWNLSWSLPFWAEQWLPGRVAYYIASYWPMEEDTHEQYWQLPANRPLTKLLKYPLRSLALRQVRRKEYRPSLKFEHPICCSQYVRHRLQEAGAFNGGAVIYPGIDTQPFLSAPARNFDEQKRCLSLLYFGSLVHHKGVHTAIEAVGLLKQRGLAERIELTVLGGGHPEYTTKLQALTHQLGIEDRVHFAGKVPRNEIPAWLERFDIYLFTSIWPEPIAATVMEAMAAGMMVIGTAVGGQVEMLTHGENALMFKAEDGAQLAEHITCVLDNPSLRVQLAQAGQKMSLERFSLERMINEIEQYLVGMVENSSQLINSSVP
jgi:glycogen(starch) synthase